MLIGYVNEIEFAAGSQCVIHKGRGDVKLLISKHVSVRLSSVQKKLHNQIKASLHK
jgi:hypothetical protein